MLILLTLILHQITGFFYSYHNLINIIIMQFNKLVLAGTFLAALSLSSCIDQKYDLSDIDTTVRVEVKDLVIPINIDEVTLGALIDIKEGDRLQEINGVYAVIEDGTFSGEGISVDAVHMDAPVINPTHNTISIPGGGASFSQIPGDVLKVNLFTDPSSFSASDNNVNSSIVSVESVGTQFVITMNLTLGGFEGKLKSFVMSDFKLQLPKALELQSAEGSYDSATGIFSASRLTGTGNVLTLNFDVTSVSTAGGALVYTVEGDNRTMTFSDEMSLKSAVLEIRESDLEAGASAMIPSSLSLGADYSMTDIDVTDFTGQIEYKIEISAFTDIDLTDLPDVLNQEGTDIRLANPQIYLGVNNPLNQYDAYATTGIAITAHREEQASATFELDAPGYFTIPGIPGQADYNFCLSPKAPAQLYQGYDNAVHVPYTSLSNVLSGDGMPQSLSIEMMDPKLPVQRVNKFRLGEDLGSVEGRYTFFAPLALEENSIIQYSDTEDGWSSDELDHITISTLTVSASVSSDLPLGVELTGYPIDVNGNRINNVEITGAHIPAGAKDVPLTLTTTGTITGLDGICFTAVVKAGSSEEALAPVLGLTLKNIRAKVSGFYQDEL